MKTWNFVLNCLSGVIQLKTAVSYLIRGKKLYRVKVVCDKVAIRIKPFISTAGYKHYFSFKSKKALITGFKRQRCTGKTSQSWRGKPGFKSLEVEVSIFSCLFDHNIIDVPCSVWSELSVLWNMRMFLDVFIHIRRR